jgi:serine/threonine protein kinase
VIPIYDVGTHEGGVFLAMELVDGESLTAWLASRPRSPAEIVGVLTAAGRGLAAAHAAGLVHRDFKPTTCSSAATAGSGSPISGWRAIAAS